MNKTADALSKCKNVFPGHGISKPFKEILMELAANLPDDEYADRYGSGETIESFESDVAKLFGKEAALFVPTGTMAQQIALRIWCERSRNFTVAMHPTAHPEIAEHTGYRFLHNIQRLQFDAPEFVGDRILTISDFESLGQTPGVVLLELPYRPLGGQLPVWDDLKMIQNWASERNIPLHMDGARIWSCRPFYEKDLSQIAALFDSVYVSFYKDLGGLGGAMLLGTKEFIDNAKVWRIRHGGRLVTMAPYVASARQGLERVLPVIDMWVGRAREIASILSEFSEIGVTPIPPHTNMFQLYIRGESRALTDTHNRAAVKTGTFLCRGFRPTTVPGYSTTEIHCWENSLSFDLAALRPFISEWLSLV